MATWKDVVAHMQSNYKCEVSKNGDAVALSFMLSGNRSHMVFVTRVDYDKLGEWAAVSAPIAKVGTVKLDTVCTMASVGVVGGVVIEGDWIMLRDSFPLVNLDVNELEQPLHLVYITADTMEKKLTGGDTY